MVQNSKPLGLFFKDNDKGFKLIFEQLQDPVKGFNQTSTIELMLEIFQDSKLNLTVDEIKKSFTYSKNMVKDEAK